jgi:hypothetical protein
VFPFYPSPPMGRNHFHSTDLADMRRALLDEDDDEHGARSRQRLFPNPDGPACQAPARILQLHGRR